MSRRWKNPARRMYSAAAAAQVDIGGAQDALAFALTAFGKRDRQIYHPDRDVAAVKPVADKTAEYPERIQNEIGQQAERVDPGAHQLEQQPVLAAQLEPRERWTLARDAARGRSLGRVVADNRVVSGSGRVVAASRLVSGSGGVDSGGRRLFHRGAGEALCHRLCRSRLGALAITTRPESVTWKR